MMCNPFTEFPGFIVLTFFNDALALPSIITMMIMVLTIIMIDILQ